MARHQHTGLESCSRTRRNLTGEMTIPLQHGVLFTDLYQLTMAQVYFSHGIAEHEASFEHYFRTYPSYGEQRTGYCVSAGLGALADRLERYRFGDQELAALAHMRSSSGAPLFGKDFLDWLGANGDFRRLILRATPDGRLVHPHTPITVVEGPLALAQLVETALLNHRNFATLLATKAARVKQAARSGTVLEFGMRRAAGLGANLATESALVGGADFSSNVAASHKVGLPAKGTHAHSLVQGFVALGGTELDAFRAFARIYPDDCVLLVDTIDTLESGIPNAITVFEELRRRGHRPAGIRLDSGDPASLVPAAARMLDEAGFGNVPIVLSDRLDELFISRLTEQLARYAEEPDRVIGRLVFGVGSRLVTSEGAPYLDGVFKLTAVRQDRRWRHAFKRTDDLAKSAPPGRKSLWRLYGEKGYARGDMVTLADEVPDQEGTAPPEPLLEDAWREGRLSGEENLQAARARRRSDLARLPPASLDLVDPAPYPVIRSPGLRALSDRVLAAVMIGEG